MITSALSVLGSGRSRDHMRVANADSGPMRVQLDVLPEPGVAIADAGDPVPAFGSDEGGTVEGELPPFSPDAAGRSTVRAECRDAAAARRAPR